MNKVIDIIIEFVNASKIENKDERKISYIDENGNYYAINGVRYLLGQIIRQYSLPWDHYYISKKAKEKWESITDEPMERSWYRDTVVFNKDNPVEVLKYKGNESKPFEIHNLKYKGDWFYYREVFHDEHMVTINDIIDDLLSLKNVDETSVKNVLDKIYVCRILKEEDRNIHPKKHRSLDINDVIHNVYNKCGVEVISGYFK